MKRVIAVLVCAVCLFAWMGLQATAMSSLVLLVPDRTTQTSYTGTFAYLEDGSLAVTSADANGSSVAIEFNNTVNLNNMPYVHLAVSSDVPFNVALKVRSDAYDVYPQITGPSWYEQFQAEAPGMNEGVAPGVYTVVLNLKNYIEYNQLPVGGEGYVYIRSIHVMAKGMGTVTVHHLAVSDMPAFAANQQGATAPPTKTPITTAPYSTHASTAPTATETTATVATVPTMEDEGSVDIPGGTVPTGVVLAMVAAVLLIGSMIAMPVLKKHPWKALPKLSLKKPSKKPPKS